MAAKNPVLPLRDELYLIAHNDDTGRPHLHPPALAVGLAGAVLIDLYLAGRIILHPANTALPVPEQRLQPRGTQPVEDLIADAALTSLHRTGGERLRAWLPAFATDLYERTRAGLVYTGILHRVTRRRLRGLTTTEVFLPAYLKWPVIARAQLRYLAAGREQPNNHTAALAGLVVTLGLTRHLYLDIDTDTLVARLRAVANGHHQPVRQILTAVDAAVGDLATATYR